MSLDHGRLRGGLSGLVVTVGDVGADEVCRWN